MKDIPIVHVTELCQRLGISVHTTLTPNNTLEILGALLLRVEALERVVNQLHSKSHLHG